MTEEVKVRKKRKSNSSKLMKLLMIIPNLFSFFGNLFSLIQSELEHTRRQIILLVLLTLFILILMFSVWLSLNALLFIYLINSLFNVISAVAIIGLINFLLLMIVCFFISRQEISITFPETRKIINDVMNK